MKHKLVGIVDYDCGNLHSIKNALDKIKVKNFIINDNQSINKATHIILPGVGAYDKAMKSLYKLNLISSLKTPVEMFDFISLSSNSSIILF